MKNSAKQILPLKEKPERSLSGFCVFIFVISVSILIAKRHRRGIEVVVVVIIIVIACLRRGAHRRLGIAGSRSRVRTGGNIGAELEFCNKVFKIGRAHV